MADKMTQLYDTIFSIGHSTHTYERFLSLLRKSGITAIADVRSSPYSKKFPHFGRELLKQELSLDGIAYSFLGDELGGRPKKKEYFCDGVADYEKMAESPDFQNGIKRVLQGASKYRIALMCSEHHPLDCHRCLLVGRALANRGVSVKHIMSNGNVADHHDIEESLLRWDGQTGNDFFASREERLAVAYKKRARKVAYSESSSEDSTSHLAAE